MTEIAIKISHISKKYRLRKSNEFYALKNISFEIKKGESIGFVGVNGSGKSTLLKIISGNVRPSEGFVEVNGKVVILDYSSGFHGELTGKENIYLKAGILGLTKQQIQQCYDSIVAFADIGDFIHQPVKIYSSGMVSRLGFAIIAHVNADIIITDEALAVGDVFFVQKCMQFIREFLKKGTFLFVSHSTNDVLSLCQQAVWLDKGMIKAIGPAPMVTQAYLDQTYLESVKGLAGQAKPLASQSDHIQSEILLSQPELGQLTNHAPMTLLKENQMRNDIQIHLPSLKRSSGLGGAKIIAVTLRDCDDTPLSWINAQKLVKLTIEVLAEQDLHSPVIGFQTMDSQGQVIFADNSYYIVEKQPVLIKNGTIFATEFTFQMPALPVGQYHVRTAIAIAENGQDMLLETIDQSMIFNSVLSYVNQGLIGAFIHSIDITQTHPANTASRAEHADEYLNVTIE